MASLTPPTARPKSLTRNPQTVWKRFFDENLNSIVEYHDGNIVCNEKRKNHVTRNPTSANGSSKSSETRATPHGIPPPDVTCNGIDGARVAYELDPQRSVNQHNRDCDSSIVLPISKSVSSERQGNQLEENRSLRTCEALPKMSGACDKDCTKEFCSHKTNEISKEYRSRARKKRKEGNGIGLTAGFNAGRSDSEQISNISSPQFQGELSGGDSGGNNEAFVIQASDKVNANSMRRIETRLKESGKRGKFTHAISKSVEHVDYFQDYDSSRTRIIYYATKNEMKCNNDLANVVDKLSIQKDLHRSVKSASLPQNMTTHHEFFVDLMTSAEKQNFCPDMSLGNESAFTSQRHGLPDHSVSISDGSLDSVKAGSEEHGCDERKENKVAQMRKLKGNGHDILIDVEAGGDFISRKELVGGFGHIEANETNTTNEYRYNHTNENGATKENKSMLYDSTRINKDERHSQKLNSGHVNESRHINVPTTNETAAVREKCNSPEMSPAVMGHPNESLHTSADTCNDVEVRTSVDIKDEQEAVISAAASELIDWGVDELTNYDTGKQFDLHLMLMQKITDDGCDSYARAHYDNVRDRNEHTRIAHSQCGETDLCLLELEGRGDCNGVYADFESGKMGMSDGSVEINSEFINCCGKDENVCDELSLIDLRRHDERTWIGIDERMDPAEKTMLTGNLNRTNRKEFIGQESSKTPNNTKVSVAHSDHQKRCTSWPSVIQKTSDLEHCEHMRESLTSLEVEELPGYIAPVPSPEDTTNQDSDYGNPGLTILREELFDEISDIQEGAPSEASFDSVIEMLGALDKHICYSEQSGTGKESGHKYDPLKIFTSDWFQNNIKNFEELEHRESPEITMSEKNETTHKLGLIKAKSNIEGGFVEPPDSEMSETRGFPVIPEGMDIENHCESVASSVLETSDNVRHCAPSECAKRYKGKFKASGVLLDTPRKSEAINGGVCLERDMPNEHNAPKPSDSAVAVYTAKKYAEPDASFRMLTMQSTQKERDTVVSSESHPLNKHTDHSVSTFEKAHCVRQCEYPEVGRSNSLEIMGTSKSMVPDGLKHLDITSSESLDDDSLTVRFSQKENLKEQDKPETLKSSVYNGVKEEVEEEKSFLASIKKILLGSENKRKLEKTLGQVQYSDKETTDRGRSLAVKGQRGNKETRKKSKKRTDSLQNIDESDLADISINETSTLPQTMLQTHVVFDTSVTQNDPTLSSYFESQQIQRNITGLSRRKISAEAKRKLTQRSPTSDCHSQSSVSSCKVEGDLVTVTNDKDVVEEVSTEEVPSSQHISEHEDGKDLSCDDLSASSIECLLEQLVQRGKIETALVMDLEGRIIAKTPNTSFSEQGARPFLDGLRGRYDGLMRLEADEVVYTCFKSADGSMLIGNNADWVCVAKRGENAIVVGFARRTAPGSCITEMVELSRVLNGRGL